MLVYNDRFINGTYQTADDVVILWSMHSDVLNLNTSTHHLHILCLRQARQAGGGIMSLCSRPVRPSVRSFVCCQTCEHGMWRKNELILTSIGTRGPHGKGLKWSTLESGGQRYKSHKAEGRFGGLAEVLSSAPWVE